MTKATINSAQLFDESMFYLSPQLLHRLEKHSHIPVGDVFRPLTSSVITQIQGSLEITELPSPQAIVWEPLP